MDNATRKRRWRKYWWILAVLIIVGIGIYAFRHRSGAATTSTADPAKSNKGGKGGGRGGAGGVSANPVIAIRARKGNIGVYFTGLGTVTPIYTVSVRSRVDGELISVLYREGDTVQKGEPLMQIDPRPYQATLDQMQGQLMRDQATLANARIDLARYQGLLKQNAIPEQQLATQQATVAQDEGTVKADEGQVENAQLNVTYTKIIAPITGRIGLRLVDPGNIVHASDSNPLLVITQMDPISVLFTIAEDQLPPVLQKLRAKQTLQVEAWDREMKSRLSTGSLSTVDNQIDQSTGTVRIRATFDNKNNGLFPNQFVNARLLVEVKRNVILLNSAAIQRNSNTTFVYLVKPDATVTIRTITVGTTEGEDSEITSGLVEGDVVVQTGADKLQEGSHVNVQIPGETPPPPPPSSDAKQSKGKKKK